MIVTLPNNSKINLSEGIDISLTLSNDEDNPRAWYVKAPSFEPVREDGWVGTVKEGGAVNFRNIFFNPHGHGTHTECLGHITEEIYSVNDALKKYFFEAQLVSVIPEKRVRGNIIDHVITKSVLLPKVAKTANIEALIIRTLPNNIDKKSKNYSSTNPPYISTECLAILKQLGVKHLLVDLPSVDKEKDNGELAFHHGFWEVPKNPQHDKTITEFVYIPNEVEDGFYFLNLQTAPFQNDAAPSRPVLFMYQ